MYNRAQYKSAKPSLFWESPIALSACERGPYSSLYGVYGPYEYSEAQHYVQREYDDSRSAILV